VNLKAEGENDSHSGGILLSIYIAMKNLFKQANPKGPNMNWCGLLLRDDQKYDVDNAQYDH
jgi:hypothetical protein